MYSSWSDTKQGAIKKVKARGGSSSTLTKQPGKYINPRFSPNGKNVVYEKVTANHLLSPDYNLHPGIYQINSSGGKPQLITEKGHSPFYSKNSRYAECICVLL